MKERHNPHEDNERTHRDNIETLVRDFGKDKADEIRRVYGEQRKILEDSAKITDFIPVLAYSLTRQVLRARYEEGYAERKSEEIIQGMRAAHTKR